MKEGLHKYFGLLWVSEKAPFSEQLQPHLVTVKRKKEKQGKEQKENQGLKRLRVRSGKKEKKGGQRYGLRGESAKSKKNKKNKQRGGVCLFRSDLPRMGSNPIFATPRSIAVSRTLALFLTSAKTSASRAERTIWFFFFPPVKILLNFEPLDSRCSGTRMTCAGPEVWCLVAMVMEVGAVVGRGV